MYLCREKSSAPYYDRVTWNDCDPSCGKNGTRVNPRSPNRTNKFYSSINVTGFPQPSFATTRPCRCDKRPSICDAERPLQVANTPLYNATNIAFL